MTIGQSLLARASATPAGGRGLSAIDHVVFLIQENRSFDHYYGALAGVRGFDDHPDGRLGVFSQAWPGGPTHLPPGRLLPFHLDSTQTPGQCVHDITHAWQAQHECWNSGAMDRFAAVHVGEDGAGAGPATMGIDGGVLIADYTDDPHTFDGIVTPTRRRLRRRLQNGTADMSADYITIDIRHAKYHTS